MDPSGAVGIQMTLTAPNCPSAQELPMEVETKARAVPGVAEAKVEVINAPLSAAFSILRGIRPRCLKRLSSLSAPCN